MFALLNGGSPPNPPSGLTAGTDGSFPTEYVLVEWVAGDAAATTRIEEYIGGIWTEIATVGAGITNYTTADAYAPGREFRARHQKNGVYSVYSNTATTV